MTRPGVLGWRGGTRRAERGCGQFNLYDGRNLTALSDQAEEARVASCGFVSVRSLAHFVGLVPLPDIEIASQRRTITMAVHPSSWPFVSISSTFHLIIPLAHLSVPICLSGPGLPESGSCIDAHSFARSPSPNHPYIHASNLAMRIPL